MNTTGHLSPLTIDALALDALPRDDRARVRSHLASCESCRDRVGRAQALRDALPPRLRVRTLDALEARMGWWSRWAGAVRLAAGPLAIATAALVVVLLMRRATPTVAEHGLAIKGGPLLQIYALRDRQVFPVSDGTVLATGDEIRFAVTPAGATQVLIASIDGGGHTTIYVPYRGDRSVAVDPDARTELPGSIVLDDAPGPERVFAVFSSAPILASDVEAELRKLATAAPDQLRTVQRLALPAPQASLVFEKLVSSR